jgi:uncharacterized SAM-binding protein YcdF (DUF218 family)
MSPVSPVLIVRTAYESNAALSTEESFDKSIFRLTTMMRFLLSLLLAFYITHLWMRILTYNQHEEQAKPIIYVFIVG